MTRAKRFSLMMAEETGDKNACPTCGATMEESNLSRSMTFWYCRGCDRFRPKKNQYGSTGTKKDPQL